MAYVSKHLRLLIICGLLILPVTASAKLFRNAYVQFELPESWECRMEGTEWICSSKSKTDAKESIIILTSKEVGPQDSFINYENHLKTPREVQTSDGKTLKSQIKHVRNRKINDHPWVDALHLGSEISGYYTRYVATIKDKLAILVTLSAHQKHFTKYSNDFFRAVESLRVIATKDLLNPRALAPIKPGMEALGNSQQVSLPPADFEPPPPDDGGNQSASAAKLGAIILLIAAIVYYIWKKRSGGRF